MNRTLAEKMRAMLIEAKLEHYLWPEALNIAVYLANRSPTVALNRKTPYECWFGKRPDFGNLRVFGCEAFMKQVG